MVHLTWYNAISWTYLELKTREDRSKAYFDAQLLDEVKYEDDDDSGVDWSGQTSLQIAEERIQEAMARERDVDVIVSSVIGLRDIYRELQSLVVHQVSFERIPVHFSLALHESSNFSVSKATDA